MNHPSPFSVSNRKIDPTRRPISHTALLPDGSPNDNDRVEIGPTDLAFAEWQALGLTPPNLTKMREYRLSRLVAELQKRDYAGLLMFDPLNIRYATDSTNMQLWVTHNPCRACFVSADGYMILWDFHGGEHLSAHLPLVREVRYGASFFYFESAQRTAELAAKFAADVDQIMRTHAGTNRRLAIDKMEYDGEKALEALGVQIMNGQEVTEMARLVKSDEELNAMRCAIAACEAAMWEMREAARPGMSEVAMWAELQKGNHIRGGEWIETRILSTGPRTNPWFQECGPRIVEDGDMLSFDTDLIGPYGYCSDLSRSWKIGDQTATAYEKELYTRAVDQIRFNTEAIKPGLTFRELVERSDVLDERFGPLRYGVLYHGVGLCDEYPSIRYPQDWESSGYDGVLVPGQCLCVESYVGDVGGSLGIKLEDQVVVTETGCENLTRFPFEEAMVN